MYDPEKNDVITERPSFDEMVAIDRLIVDCSQSLSGLSDGQDTLDRAGDLVTAVDNLQEAVYHLCLMPKDE